MARDVLAEMGYLALGSRLKRLAERMQADATKAFVDRGIPVQATHFPLARRADHLWPDERDRSR